MNMMEVCFNIKKNLNELTLKNIRTELKLIPSVIHVQVDPIAGRIVITYEGEIGTLEEIKMAISPDVFHI